MIEEPPEVLTLEVTAEDIAAGKQGDCSNCPIALAIKRKIPGAEYVDVSDGMANFELNHSSYDYGLPDDANAFIQRFDDFGKKEVSPAKFEMLCA